MQVVNSQAPAVAAPHGGGRTVRVPLGRKIRLLLLVNLASFAILGLCAEAGLRLFWRPRVWVHAEGWLVGSGFGPAGRKWWPDARYWIEGKEFFVRFRSDATGYRARPEPPRTANPYRVAFVGDSFTEAKQVEYEQSFVARLERGLDERAGGREVVGVNYGIAGTGFFDYWHRVTHDVLRPGARPPEMLVLCIYPGNDFTDPIPADGFDADDQPRREYYRTPGWSQHVLTWLNLKSKLAHFVLFSLKIATEPVVAGPQNIPAFWWNDPAGLGVAETSAHVRHVRALLRALEAECDRHGTRLVLLIVPAHQYSGNGEQSPLSRIFGAWGLRALVIDVAAHAKATPQPARLVFPLDGHLNPAGHAYVAADALGPLGEALGFANARHTGRSGPSDSSSPSLQPL